MAFGKKDALIIDHTVDWIKIDQFIAVNKNHYIFSFLNYDLKNNIEALHSNNAAFIEFPLAFFCVPEVVVSLQKDQSYTLLEGNITPAIELEIQHFLSHCDQADPCTIALTPTLSKEEYIKKVLQLQQHIQRGDIYEVTFCQDFRAENAHINAKLLFHQLNQITNAPMSAFVKYDDRYLLCGSPERFLQRSGDLLRSQPIKGTAKRSENPVEDEQNRKELQMNPKEQSENVMIVDLVRNDLSRIAAQNSVNVEELCGIYTFPTVHQLISSISATVSDDKKFSHIIKALFPMGSMTGAPKIRAMELIDQYEDFQRGLFSGSVGCITPNGNFDYNVVIRSILYDTTTQRVSCPVGSAITIQSNPENEYKECLTKVEAMKKVLNHE